MLSPAGAANAHVALSMYAPWLVAAPSAAISAPPCAHVFLAYWSNAPPGATEPLQPSAGAGCPDGVRQPYTWYCPARATGTAAASAAAVRARTPISAVRILRITISIQCRSLGASCPPARSSHAARAEGGLR